jgi:hypothetical protein
MTWDDKQKMFKSKDKKMLDITKNEIATFA